MDINKKIQGDIQKGLDSAFSQLPISGADERTAAASKRSEFRENKKEVDEKWSEKYKNSIDCNNPKGFSQKAHCQGKKKKKENKEATGAASAGGYTAPLFGDMKEQKKKKVETKEATGSGSSGSYVTPAAWAKSQSKKDWRGASKTQIPGGKFVQVKKKCTKFPYCNQGDIKALKLFDNKLVESVIKNLSKKYQISEEFIKNIITKEYRKTAKNNLNK